MSGFEDLTLGWGGKSFVIPARKMLGAVARIEEVITLQELTAYASRGTAPMARLAQAYGSVLRYAGAAATDDEVYSGLFGDAGPDNANLIADSINTLMVMMIPPHVRRKMNNGEGDGVVRAKGEAPVAGNSSATGKNSSKGTSKQRSRKGGARR
jgi:hypothetical protein